MNIYFVNKNSKLKGPFDITDANHQHIIRIGDVCLYDKGNILQVLFVMPNSKTWSTCKCIGYSNLEGVKDGNSLLFSFNGLAKRKGDIETLRILSDSFFEEPAHSLFLCALDILLYKRDYWDVEIFSHIIKEGEIERQEDLQDTKKDTNSQEYLFASYFDKPLIKMFNDLMLTNISLRDVYSKIKKQYPKEFRFSLKKFITEHPQSNIYEKS